MTAEQLGLTIMAISQVPTFLSNLLPDPFTVQTSEHDPARVSSLRRGEVLGGALALSVGAGASIVARSWIPFLGCAAVLAALLTAHEHAIRNPVGGRDKEPGGYRLSF